MSFSNETNQKINQFAKEQAQNYLEEAQMTYLEKLRAKTSQTKRKIGRKLARFRGSSDQALEARNDMILYMSDYMNDLISQGLSEQEAFDKAKEELSAPGNSDFQADLHERFSQYYENRDPADYEAIGLLYAGFLFLGIAIGALIGFLASGGVPAFLQEGWIYTLVGTGVGTFIGLGLGELGHAILISVKRK